MGAGVERASQQQSAAYPGRQEAIRARGQLGFEGDPGAPLTDEHAAPVEAGLACPGVAIIEVPHPVEPPFDAGLDATNALFGADAAANVAILSGPGAGPEQVTGGVPDVRRSVETTERAEPIRAGPTGAGPIGVELVGIGAHADDWPCREHHGVPRLTEPDLSGGDAIPCVGQPTGGGLRRIRDGRGGEILPTPGGAEVHEAGDGRPRVCLGPPSVRGGINLGDAAESTAPRAFRVGADVESPAEAAVGDT